MVELLHGVGSLLDESTTQGINSDASKLRREFGAANGLVMPHPHLTYQVARGYDRAPLESMLASLAREITPFTIRTVGLSALEGPWPTIFLEVDNNSELRSIQRRVWDVCLPLAREPFPYYHPGSWSPHITLVHADYRNPVSVPQDLARRVVDSLKGDEHLWTISIDNLALSWDDGATQRPVQTFPLGEL